MPYPTLFLTERSAFHQQQALAAAPPELAVTMLCRPTRADLAPYLADTVFLISERAGVIDAELIHAMPQLKLIVRLGSLAYDIDVDAARERSVPVVLWPVRGSIQVAEHAIMQMLALTKRLLHVNRLALSVGDWAASRRTDEDTFAYNWTRTSGIEGLWGKTVGVLGYGEIGAELSRRLHGWGCTVLYHRRRQLPPAAEAELKIEYRPCAELLAQSDIVVNLLPYAAETDHLLGATALAQMKPGALLVSCGSGSVIDEAALAGAVREGRLGGVALDTYEWEPLIPANPLRLLALDRPQLNILLTPHTAAGSPPAGQRASRAEDYAPILRYLRNETPT